MVMAVELPPFDPPEPEVAVAPRLHARSVSARAATAAMRPTDLFPMDLITYLPDQWLGLSQGVRASGPRRSLQIEFLPTPVGRSGSAAWRPGARWIPTRARRVPGRPARSTGA